jgi:HEAT repeat protein
MRKGRIQSLLNSLQEANSFSRRQAVRSLEEIGDKSVIPTLIEVMLKDKSPYVRRAAAVAFQGRLSDKSAVPALIKALKDSNPYVGGAAAAALGKIKDKSAVPHLCKALKVKEPHLQWSVALSLGELGDASAIPALRELLEDPSQPPFVKSAATIALKRLGEE